MALPVVIKRVVTIECGDNCRSPWLIDNLENIEGREFLKLAHKDIGFCRFVAGNKFRKIGNMQFLHDLQRRRSQATMDACATVPAIAQSLFDDVTPTVAAKKKARKDAKSRAALGALPSTVVLEMPSITTIDDHPVPATTLRVKSSIDVRDAVMVELDPHMIYYIKHAMLSSFTDDGVKYDRGPADGVRWRSDRTCWLARRQNEADPERVITKSFKPKDDDPISIQEAADDAAAWADGRDSCDEQDDAREPCEAAHETSDGMQRSGDLSSATALDIGVGQPDTITDTPVFSVGE